ncbi:MAG: hypothetical protein HUU10_01020 [Bacteroidetes bacterium]|nr:hypothetical protein [Bacteroidota bacterium]
MNRFLFNLISSGALLLAGCSETDHSSADGVDYRTEIQPVFNRSCALSGCHADDATSLGKVFHGDSTLRLTSWEEVGHGTGSRGSVVVPFQPVFSSLFQHINGSVSAGPVATPRMPLNMAPLPDREIALISQWILEGAREKPDAQPMYSASGSGFFLITNQGEDLLTRLTGNSAYLSRIIPLYSPVWPVPAGAPQAPHYLALDQERQLAYLSLYSAGKVIRVDLASRQITGSIHVGGNPAHVELLSGGNELLVTNFSSQNRIHRIDTRTMTLIRDYTGLASNPHALVVLPGDSVVFTGGQTTDLLYRISLRTGNITSFPVSRNVPPTGSVSQQYGIYQIRFQKSDGRLYITCKTSGEVRVADPTTGDITDSVQVGKNPLLAEFRPGTNELWVANQGNRSVSIINTVTRQVTTLGDLPAQPHGIAFSSDGRRAGLTCENQTGDLSEHHPTTRGGPPGYFVLFDAATRTQLASRPVGSFAAGIAWMP